NVPGKANQTPTPLRPVTLELARVLGIKPSDITAVPAAELRRKLADPAQSNLDQATRQRLTDEIARLAGEQQAAGGGSAGTSPPMGPAVPPGAEDGLPLPLTPKQLQQQREANQGVAGSPPPLTPKQLQQQREAQQGGDASSLPPATGGQTGN